MKKLVLQVEVNSDKEKSKVMQAVSGFLGIGSLNMDMKDKKLTVSGDFDPVKVVNKMRKSWKTDIVSLEPAKEEDGNEVEGNRDQVANPIKPCLAYPWPITYYHVPYEEPPYRVRF